MKFPFARPPNTAGIYALINQAARKIYIGQSVNLRARYVEWATCLHNKYARSKRLIEAIMVSAPEDWTFNVLEHGICENSLNEREAYWVCNALAKYGDDCLNSPDSPAAKGLRPPIPYTPPGTTITRSDGSEISYDDAAKELGLDRRKFVNRLGYWRRKGVFTFTMDKLRHSLSNIKRFDGSEN